MKELLSFLSGLSNLQFLLIIASIAFMIFSLRLYLKKRIGLLSFILLFGGSLAVGIFSLKVERLNAIGVTFGLNRGADLIVYVSIIILFYIVIKIYTQQSHLHKKQTDIIRAISIDQGIGSYRDSEIVFVIPAYNESDYVIDLLEAILDLGYGIVFIDDGSKNTLYQKVVHTFQNRNLRAIRHISNLGQGAALQTGFQYLIDNPGKVQYVVTFDSDGQHCLDDLPVFLKAFEKNKKLEIALGSRFMGKTINMPKSKKLILKFGILFTSFFSGLHLTDTHNGYRVIKYSSLPKITITLNGMEHASEILDIISVNKMNYAEVPNTIVYTEYSMARGQKLSNSLKIVKNLILKKLFS